MDSGTRDDEQAVTMVEWQRSDARAEVEVSIKAVRQESQRAARTSRRTAVWARVATDLR